MKNKYSIVEKLTNPVTGIIRTDPRMEPDSANGYRKRGLEYLNKGDYDRAIDDE
jgi:hypothetical protein